MLLQIVQMYEVFDIIDAWYRIYYIYKNRVYHNVVNLKSALAVLVRVVGIWFHSKLEQFFIVDFSN